MNRAAWAAHASRAYRGVFWSTVNAVYLNLAGLLAFVAMSRLLAPEDFGLSAVAGAAVAFFAMVLPSGFGEALVQRKALEDVHIDSVFWLAIGIGGLAAAAAVACGHVLAIAYGAPTLRGLVPVLAARILFDAFGLVPNALIARAMDFRVLVVRTAITTLASGLVGVLLALAGCGAWSLVVAQVAAAALSAVVAFRASGYRPRSLGSWTAIRELWAYGAFATGTRGVQFLSSQADQLVIGWFLGTEAVGLYAFAKRAFTIANDLTSGVLAAVAHPAFSSAQGDMPLVLRGFLRATSSAAMVAFPLFAGLAATAPALVAVLFGPRWEGAAAPLSLLCVLGPITCVGAIQAALITSCGKASWWFGYQLLSGFANLAVYVGAAPFGLRAMLAVFICRTYLFWPIPVAMTMRLLGLGFNRYLLPFLPPLAASAVLFGVVIGVGAAWPGASPWERLATQVPAGLLAYTGTLAMLAPGSLRTFAQSLYRVGPVRHA